MGKRERKNTRFDWNEVSEEERDLTDKKPLESNVKLSSSDDDDEANQDLSLKIVEKSLLIRAAKLAADSEVFSEEPIGLVELPSSSKSQEAEISAADLDTEKLSRTKRKKKIKKMKNEDQSVVAKEEEKVEETNSVRLAEVKPLNSVEMIDNVVLRKLLRGPRYFDPPNTSWGTCFNCGEEGHAAVNCTMAKRKKPCFVCGSLEHNAKQCRKGQDCFICKKGGHHARDCPEKHKGGSLKSQICLKCGDSGHDMFSCRNDYSTDDLKEVQCYVCKMFGHLCCVKNVDASSREVSCYRCGLSGHTGTACGRFQGGETADFGSARLCYKCGEGGHIARECTISANVHKRFGKVSKFSTPPSVKSHKEKRDYMGIKSAPHDLNKDRKRKQILRVERGPMTPPKSKHSGGWVMDDPGDFSPRRGKKNGWMPPKSKHRGGWVVDDPGDFSPRRGKKNGWKSPSTPSSRGHTTSRWNAGGHSSSSKSSQKMWHVSGSPNSCGSSKPSQHGYSASRFSNLNGDGPRRNYDWW